MRYKIFTGTIIFVLLATLFCSAKAASDSDLSTLSVTGTGESKTKPDIAIINISVDKKGRTASEAAGANASGTQKLIDALERNGILEKDIQTSNISIFPIYKPNPASFESEQKIIAYQATNSLSATIRKIGDVGRIIDSIVLTGDYTISGVSFDLENDDNAEAEALRKAVTDAKRKADIVATQAGKTITGIKSISIGGGSTPIFKSGLGAFAEGISTPILPGDITVSSSVSVEYTISK